MKQAITYLLLFAYSTIILKPLLPYTSDFIAHIFWYKDHMATVHSHNGKFHVHKEILDTSKKESKESGNAILKKDFSATDHVKTSCIEISFLSISAQHHFPINASQLVNSFASINYPPPK